MISTQRAIVTFRADRSVATRRARTLPPSAHSSEARVSPAGGLRAPTGDDRDRLACVDLDRRACDLDPWWVEETDLNIIHRQLPNGRS
jgi:hypothetical protein